LSLEYPDRLGMVKAYLLSHILQFPSLSVVIVKVMDTVVPIGVKLTSLFIL